MIDRQVSQNELAQLPCPKATSSYFPVSHYDVARISVDSLQSAGYQIRNERWTLSNNEQRIFGVIDLNLPLARWDSPGKGVTVSIGVRSSYDKKLPLGIVAGSRVFVCSNLAFCGEISYKRKHTKFGYSDFQNQITQAIDKLRAYQALESERINSWMNFEMSNHQSDALLLALFESGTISTRQFQQVLAEYRKPSFEDFSGKITLWNFFNRITTALRERGKDRPLSHSSETSQLINQLNLILKPPENNIIQPLAIEYSGD